MTTRDEIEQARAEERERCAKVCDEAHERLARKRQAELDDPEGYTAVAEGLLHSSEQSRALAKRIRALGPAPAAPSSQAGEPAIDDRYDVRGCRIDADGKPLEVYIGGRLFITADEHERQMVRAHYAPRAEAPQPAPSQQTWDGWLTCARCSSLGLDKAIGREPFPTSGACSACGGTWPARAAAPSSQPGDVRAWGERVAKAVHDKALLASGAGQCSCHFARCGHDEAGEEISEMDIAAALSAAGPAPQPAPPETVAMAIAKAAFSVGYSAGYDGCIDDYAPKVGPCGECGIDRGDIDNWHENLRAKEEQREPLLAIVRRHLAASPEATAERERAIFRAGAVAEGGPWTNSEIDDAIREAVRS